MTGNALETHTKRHRSAALFSIVFVIASGACSSDDDSSSSKSPATGAAAGSGGASTANSGGSQYAPEFFGHPAGPGGALPSDYSLQACAGVTPDSTVTTGASECSQICGAAHCVDAKNAGGVTAMLPDCKAAAGGSGKCIPDKIIELGGKFAWRSCDYGAGTPGVCIPACLILEAGAVWLNKGTCADGELCTACGGDACGDRCTGSYPTFHP
jgi:hypothetical protein